MSGMCWCCERRAAEVKEYPMPLCAECETQVEAFGLAEYVIPTKAVATEVPNVGSGRVVEILLRPECRIRIGGTLLQIEGAECLRVRSEGRPSSSEGRPSTL